MWADGGEAARSDRNFGAEHDGAFLWELKELGVAGGVVGEGDEQAFTPGGHSRGTGAAQRDPRNEVGDLLGVDSFGKGVGGGVAQDLGKVG
ncbi:hypothetical protein GCM10027614_41220 [Micromonospora vulcania]